MLAPEPASERVKLGFVRLEVMLYGRRISSCDVGLAQMTLTCERLERLPPSAW